MVVVPSTGRGGAGRAWLRRGVGRGGFGRGGFGQGGLVRGKFDAAAAQKTRRAGPKMLPRSDEESRYTALVNPRERHHVDVPRVFKNTSHYCKVVELVCDSGSRLQR